MNIVSVAEMRKMEADANRLGYTYAMMMDAAGKGLAEWIARSLVTSDTPAVVGLVGSGNNGGDTLIALRELRLIGLPAIALLVGSMTPDNPLVLQLENAGGKVIFVDRIAGLSEIEEYIEPKVIVLDGVFGTGFRSPLPQNVINLFDRIRIHQDAIVVAVDCPSGVDCDTGEADPNTLHADWTICMQAIKHGLLKYPAFRLSGKVDVIDLGMPLEISAGKYSTHELLDEGYNQVHLPSRPLNAHKGSFGRLMIIGGSQPFTGAPVLAARAAYRVGAGLVDLAVAKQVYYTQSGLIPEAIWNPLPVDSSGYISSSSLMAIETNLALSNAIVLGPGLGRARDIPGLVEKILTSTACPASVVIDADGLQALTGIQDWWKRLPAGAVLTPHPGEMAALCGASVSEIQENRFEIAQKWAKEWQVVLVLKGALTIVSDHGERALTLAKDLPALAKAGTGDVLAGMIGGFLAQGVHPYDASGCAVWLHARCAEYWMESQSGRSMLASDVIELIPRVLFGVEKKEPV